MKVIVVGLGRMGSGLAISLCRKGQDVVAIDKDATSFDHVAKEFTGQKVVGVAFDRDVLTEAGIEEAAAVVCCTNSDEVNALVARIAKNIYHVPRVVARLYDIHNAEIYRRLDIQTISTTSWGIQRAMEIISYGELDSVYKIGSGSVTLKRIVVPSNLVGLNVNSVEETGRINVVAVSRDQETFIPTKDTTFQVDDILYVAVDKRANDQLSSELNLK